MCDCNRRRVPASARSCPENAIVHGERYRLTLFDWRGRDRGFDFDVTDDVLGDVSDESAEVVGLGDNPVDTFLCSPRSVRDRVFERNLA